MPLFQKTPVTPEEIEKNRPLALSPDEVSALDDEAWYARAYRGDDAAQLTPRAALMGATLGFFLALTNLYIGLKTGWHIGVALTACILSFSIHNFLRHVGLSRSPMGILENNCVQSTASAAGYSTGSTLVSAIPALLMLSATTDNPRGTPLPWPVLAGFTLFSALLGVTLAIPMKRNLINQEKLRFPSGTAAAVTLQGLYNHGESALIKARALIAAACVSGLVPVLKDLNIKAMPDAAGKLIRAGLLPSALKIFDWLPGIRGGGKVYAPSEWGIKLDYGPALLAAGALIGLRVTLSMVAGGLFVVLVLGPLGMASSWVNPAGAVVTAVTRPAAAYSQIGTWLGAPVMVSASLLSFAMQWRTIARAFKGLGGGGGEVAALSSSQRIEVPLSWFLVGGSVAGAGLVAIARSIFEIPIHFGILAVLFTFVLALVACRATGESDVTPTGAMGKIMQLTYGVLIPQNATANLMTAAITSGAAASSADLLTDLKAGYLLGANPRRQFVAQLLGVLPGTVATVAGFYILVPDATALTGVDGRDPAFGAPAAQQWMAVAKVFKLGIGHLHPLARQCIFAGVILGMILVLLERALPRYKRWLPSATGVGLGLILPFYQPLQMALGAIVAALLSRNEGRVKDLIIPVASGLIAGESIVGVVVTAVNNFILK
jgi:uncharacterized oligopeptide transporter (OPT) family protein